MHAKKTGALIRASAVAGAMMGGGSDAQVAAIDAAAAEFGLAFQIVDDILDVEGASAELGKTRGQGRRGRQAHLSGALRPRPVASDGRRPASLARRETLDRAPAWPTRWLLGIGRWIVERRN